MSATRKFTDRQTREIQLFVSVCFHAMKEENVKVIAKRTGLCVTTIYRLQKGLVSRATHIGTIQDLGKAAGLRLVFTRNGRVYMEAA